MIKNSDQKYIKEKNGKYTIFSGLPEFGYELLAIIPFCYNLYKQGILEKTISGFDTKCFYFFSKNHEEVIGKRSYKNVKLLSEKKFPNIDIHRNMLEWEKFTPPPFKERYKEEAILFSKPTVIITNRINNEWNGPPINFLSSKVILDIAKLLSSQYQVVLIQSSDFTEDYEDHASFKEVGLSEELCRQHEIITIKMLQNEYLDLSINELQCRLYAGCEKFISSNGGFGILASYFGGENIIFSKMCHELDPDVNSFHTWYYKLSGCIITVVHEEKELIDVINSKWVLCDVLFNIVIRTSGRPNYFHDCIVSILKQNYSNYRIIVGIDDEKSVEYVRKHPCNIVELKKNNEKKQLPPANDGSYGEWFPFNAYFNILQKNILQGYIIYLDDDDKLLDNNVLSSLNIIIKKTKSDLLFWRVQFPDRLVPCDVNWKLKMPVCRDIDTVGFCFKSALKPAWEPWKRGDFRVAKWLVQNSEKNLWVDKVFTMLQRNKETGKGRRDDKMSIYTPENPPIAIIITAYNASAYIKQCLDSVFENLRELKNSSATVLLGIDACKSTLNVAKSLTRLYGHQLQVYRSENNCGTYLLKNSLLKKISRRDTIVLFFDSDDLLVPGFILAYYRYFMDLLESKKYRYDKLILRTRSIGVPDFAIQKSEAVCSERESIFAEAHRLIAEGQAIQSVPYLLSLLKKLKFKSRINELIYHLVRFNLVKNDDALALGEKQYGLNSPHGVFMTTYDTIMKLGFFNPYRVGQDTDLLNRARLSNVKRVSDDTLPFFIRRITDTSLTKSKDFGYNSKYRQDVYDANLKLIESGVLVANGDSVILHRVL